MAPERIRVHASLRALGNHVKDLGQHGRGGEQG
jgi:hypothetical protein